MALLGRVKFPELLMLKSQIRPRSDSHKYSGSNGAQEEMFMSILINISACHYNLDTKRKRTYDRVCSFSEHIFRVGYLPVKRISHDHLKYI